MEKTKLYRYTRYWGDGNVCERGFFLNKEDAEMRTDVFKGTQVEPYVEVVELDVNMDDYTCCEGCDIYYENDNVAQYKGYDYCKDCIINELA